MIQFRLSDETKMLLKKDTKIPSLPKKRADITVAASFTTNIPIWLRETFIST